MAENIEIEQSEKKRGRPRLHDDRRKAWIERSGYEQSATRRIKKAAAARERRRRLKEQQLEQQSA